MDRNAKLLRVSQHIGHLVAYVQGVADAQPTVPDAITVILSAGLGVKKTAKRSKAELTATYTGISGEALLRARAVPGAYFWESSLDRETWESSIQTTRGKAVLAGLTPGKMYYFRFRVLTRKGKSDPSQVVSLLAH